MTLKKKAPVRDSRTGASLFSVCPTPLQCRSLARRFFRAHQCGRCLLVRVQCRQFLLQIQRDPGAAATRFPNLSRESALQKLKHVEKGGHYGGGFQPTVLVVHRLTVRLDDAAKEGLVYAMRFLSLNHADAARWLLTNAQIPESPNQSPVKKL